MVLQKGKIALLDGSDGDHLRTAKGMASMMTMLISF
jgi:hypothetical protein